MTTKPKLPNKAKLNRWAKKYMKILGMKGPMPTFQFPDHKIWTWLARTTVHPGSSKTLIEIQRAATIDDRTLERVVAHEVIHHFNFSQMHPFTMLLTSLAPGTYDIHGADFQKGAKKINLAVKQPKFVTKDYDKSFILAPKADKVWLLILKRAYSSEELASPRRPVSQFGFCWTDRPNHKKVKEILKRMSEVPNTSGKFVQVTTEPSLLFGPRLEDEEIAVPVGKDGKQTLKILQEIYDSPTPQSRLIMFFDNSQPANPAAN